MTSSPDQNFAARLRDLQDQLEEELARRRAEIGDRIERGRVVFDAEMRRRHRAARVRLGTFLAATRPMVVLTAPVIYGLILPLAFLDLAVTVYQQICFRAYGMVRVRRADYVYLDRHQLAYLNGLQKLNCVYCGYANGVIAYVREVAARTEQYWCPIKHSRRVADPHARYPEFADYGDAAAFHGRSVALRDALRRPD